MKFVNFCKYTKNVLLLYMFLKKKLYNLRDLLEFVIFFGKNMCFCNCFWGFGEK